MKTNQSKGLTTSEAEGKLRTFGYNELSTTKPKNILQIALEVIREPMFILILACGGLYIILGDYNEGIILLSASTIIISITFIQYRKTEKALESLKQLASPRALVIRDEKEIHIASREVVPDDIIILNEGDRVPADAIIIEATNLMIDESILTGESIPINKSETTEENNSTFVYSGTLVMQGKGFVKVCQTGEKTAFGKIGTSLKNIKEEQTKLQSEMKILIRNLAFIGVALSISVVILFYLSRGNFINSLLIGLSSAMTILPEEFPVVLTIFFALGSWRLSQNNVLVRKPASIETLGSATVLCSDKTGTITKNKMEVVAAYTGTEIIPKNQFSTKNEVKKLFMASCYASQKEPVDPMEKAIKSNYDQIANECLNDILIKEYAFSKSLLAMTRVLKNSKTNEITVSTKGAPEAIFQLCRMNEEDTKRNTNALHEMAGKGLRVLGVASATITENNLPEDQEDFDFTFLGLIGLEDAIRPEVPNAVKECLTAGVRVIMITGDFPITAKSIAQQIGLEVENKIITGKEMLSLSDEQFKERIKNINVFARVIPEQKLRIVEALKANGEIVAMTGDGVNDAPALKASHIGVAMGMKGTDVARESSALILLDDNFASIVSAIHLGRRVFDNLEKAMSYIIAIHIPIIGLTLLPAIFNDLTILLFPIHIVFLELIIDPICSVAFESEQEELGIMKRPPRDPNQKFFGGKKIAYGIFQGLVLLTVVLIVYFQSIGDGHTDKEIRTITFSTLLIGNVALILTNLSKTRNIFFVMYERNKALRIILFLALLILLLVITIPMLQQLFSFEYAGFKHFIPVFIGVTIFLLLFETVKWLRNRRE